MFKLRPNMVQLLAALRRLREFPQIDTHSRVTINAVINTCAQIFLRCSDYACEWPCIHNFIPNVDKVECWEVLLWKKVINNLLVLLISILCILNN